MEDDKIIELFWERSESAIAELDKKYGSVCRKIAFNILGDGRDAEECISSSTETDSGSMEELEKAIRGFLDSLEPKNRVLFLKRYWFAESLEDISKELHISKSAAKVKLFRLRKRLREALEREGITI